MQTAYHNPATSRAVTSTPQQFHDKAGSPASQAVSYTHLTLPTNREV